MYQLIQITKINDFIFCPYSIYLHAIYESFTQQVYHQTPQTTGKANHKIIENNKYSTSKHVLQGIPVYSEKYQLIGKIDIYDQKEKTLIERKTKVKKIYDGYKYQLYAQYFCLLEQGYAVEKLCIHSLTDNKRYKISIPDAEEQTKFEEVLQRMWHFEAEKTLQKQPPNKCNNCIYSTLCEFSTC
ncbi:MAG: type V CRISPR-associated protein Cas4 [bacterium]